MTMTKLALTKEETKQLKEKDKVIVTRDDFTILVERLNIFDANFYKMTLLFPFEIELFKEENHV